jgi:hypothetical protein
MKSLVLENLELSISASILPGQLTNYRLYSGTQAIVNVGPMNATTPIPVPQAIIQAHSSYLDRLFTRGPLLRVAQPTSNISLPLTWPMVGEGFVRIVLGQDVKPLLANLPENTQITDANQRASMDPHYPHHPRQTPRPLHIHPAIFRLRELDDH